MEEVSYFLSLFKVKELHYQVMLQTGRKDQGPRDHAMSLVALCAICGRKGPGLRDITVTLEDRI